MTLTPEEKAAVEQAGSEPVRLEVPETHREYVLLRAKTNPPIQARIQRDSRSFGKFCFTLSAPTSMLSCARCWWRSGPARASRGWQSGTPRPAWAGREAGRNRPEFQPARGTISPLETLRAPAPPRSSSAPFSGSLAIRTPGLVRHERREGKTTLRARVAQPPEFSPPANPGHPTSPCGESSARPTKRTRALSWAIFETNPTPSALATKRTRRHTGQVAAILTLRQNELGPGQNELGTVAKRTRARDGRTRGLVPARRNLLRS